jgi:hypothetical protein
VTPGEQHSRLETEREQIRAAMRRLLAGTPERSDGKLTAVTLATEAGLPRHRLYEHHFEVVAEFKIAAGGGPVPPSVSALQQQLADAQERVRELEEDNKLLQNKLTTLCAVITELTHQAHADNVTAMPPRRRRTSSPR